MASSNSQQKINPRTVQIPVEPVTQGQPDQAHHRENPEKQAINGPSAAHYELHIESVRAPNEVIAKAASTADSPKSDHVSRKFRIPGLPRSIDPKRPLKNRFWSILEWFGTSALIFIVIFFILNYQAYSLLFISKINQIWGQPPQSGNASDQNEPNNSNHSASPVQQPLPLAPAPDQEKKQVPSLNLAITPPDDRIILPRIQKNVPIVRVSEENLLRQDWNALEKDIQKALQDGVIHYPGSAFPGMHGNTVITGHSSYYLSDPGRFKDVFALLHQLTIGDTVIIYYQQQKYTYQIYDKKVVTPDKVEVLTQDGGDRLTLITCTPVGTNLKRLVILAHQISQ